MLLNLLKHIFQEENQTGFAAQQNRLTKEEIIITMSAGRFTRFFRKFRDNEGWQAEVANGWVTPAKGHPAT